MDDRDFFDHLYQMWTKTTGAEKMFWDYKEHPGAGCFIEAVQEDGVGWPVANGLEDADADWITAVHGCFADLWRRLHSALDEADTADYGRDARECRIAELEIELADLRKVIDGTK